jgi:hypothetical protein
LQKRGHGRNDGEELLSRPGNNYIDISQNVSTRKKKNESTSQRASRVVDFADQILGGTNELLGLSLPTFTLFYDT